MGVLAESDEVGGVTDGLGSRTTETKRCPDCGMRYAKSDPERFEALHRSFKGPKNTICNREWRRHEVATHLAYWQEEQDALDALDCAVGHNDVRNEEAI